MTINLGSNAVVLNPRLISSSILLALLLFSCEPQKGEEHFEQAIVYTADKDGYNLYQIDELGQWEKQLTFSEGQEWFPKWNESFGTIVYYAQDVEGQITVKLLGRPDLDSIAFSGSGELQYFPDGKSVLIAVKQGQKVIQNYQMHKIGSQSITALTHGDFYNHSAAISPDSRHLAFISNRSGTEELYILKIEGLVLTRLTDNNLIEGWPSWSPDGNQIAFTLREGYINSNEDIFIMNTNGSDLIQITDTPYPEKELAWSPEGKKIAFHATTLSDGDQIYTISLDDSRFVKITSGDFYHAEPTWIKVK